MFFAIENAYIQAIQYDKDYRYDIHTAIAQGIPYEERSTGEWIDCSEDYGYVECPVCEHLTTCDDNKDELHYCWYCGSKMGKDGAE